MYLKPSTWWRIFGPVALVFLVYGFMQLGPAWSAHQGRGEKGTWTVTRVACGSKRCNDFGTFVSADGSDVRSGIPISGGSSLGVGGILPALDSGGDKVYPPGGGSAWLVYTIGTAAFALLGAAWAWIVPIMGIRRRRAAHQSPSARTTSPPEAAGSPRHAKKTWTL